MARKKYPLGCCTQIRAGGRQQGGFGLARSGAWWERCVGRDAGIGRRWIYFGWSKNHGHTAQRSTARHSAPVLCSRHPAPPVRWQPRRRNSGLRALLYKMVWRSIPVTVTLHWYLKSRIRLGIRQLRRRFWCTVPVSNTALLPERWSTTPNSPGESSLPQRPCFPAASNITSTLHVCYAHQLPAGKKRGVDDGLRTLTYASSKLTHTPRTLTYTPRTGPNAHPHITRLETGNRRTPA